MGVVTVGGTTDRTVVGDAAFIGDGCPWLLSKSGVPPMRKCRSIELNRLATRSLSMSTTCDAGMTAEP